MTGQFLSRGNRPIAAALRRRNSWHLDAFDRTNSYRQEIVLAPRRCGDGIPGTWTLLIGQILIAKKSSYRWGAAVTEFLALGRFDRTNSCRQEIVLSLGRCADGILGARTL